MTMPRTLLALAPLLAGSADAAAAGQIHLINPLPPGPDMVKARFDPAAARLALEPGQSILRGRRYVKPYGGLLTRKVYADGEAVVLLPMSPYLDEWEKRYRSMHSIGLERMSKAVWNHSALVMTDNEGRFEFQNLKPGRYLLVSTQGFSMHAHVIPEVGETITTAPSGDIVERLPIYGPSKFIHGSFTDFYVRVVEVPKDGAIVDLGKIND